MSTILITCDTGKKWITEINATLPEAVNHFMGMLVPDKHWQTNEGKTQIHTVISVTEAQS